MKKIFFLLPVMAVFPLLFASCEKTPPEDELPEIMLEVSPSVLEYDDEDASANVVAVTSNVSWKAVSRGGAETNCTAGGAGRTEISVLSAPEGESFIVVTSVPRNGNDRTVSREVRIVREGQQPGDDPEPDTDPELIYYDDLDGGTPPSSNSWIDTWPDFANATGSGAADVEYSGRSFQSRDSYPSRGYEGASGNNAFYSNAVNAHVMVSGIVLPAGERTFRFSFGSLGSTEQGSFIANEDIVLEAGDEDGNFVRLDYDRTSSTQQWALCETVFSIDGTVPQSISFRFTADARYIRIDDLRLETSSGPAEHEINFDVTENVYPWPELPETVEGSADYKYITHHATTVRTGKRVRNYVSCYDVRRHNPMWVASAHHACYTEGAGRSTPDPWRPDPELDESEQSIIYPSDWNNWYSGISGWPTDNMYYWSNVNFSLPYRADGSGTFSFTKGHMLRSNDRPGNGEEINLQTFYPANISPELYLHTNTWGIVEGALSDRWTCSDTTYVVTGCYYGDDSYQIVDASSWGEWSDRSKICIMPEARYRVILRTRSGNTGKPVAECSADELIAIGFWFPMALEGQTVYEENNKSEWIFSVSEIEQKIGGAFRFFPTVPEEVKSGYVLSDWGL